MSLEAWQMQPESRGRVETAAPDPHVPPKMTLGFLQHVADQQAAATRLRSVPQGPRLYFSTSPIHRNLSST